MHVPRLTLLREVVDFVLAISACDALDTGGAIHSLLHTNDDSALQRLWDP